MIKEYQLRKLQNSYEVTLYYKGVKVRVNFTGGNVYNKTMPKLRTNDLFKMRAVENSELFRNREVVLVRTIQEKSDSATARPAVQQRKAPAKTVARPAASKAADKTGTHEITDDTQDGGDGSQAMEFQNLGEAILYIAQNWQEQAKNETEARKILKAHGINPKIKKG